MKNKSIDEYIKPEEFDHKAHVKFNDRIILPEDVFNDVLLTCMSHGIYLKSEFDTEEEKLEIRFIEFFCFETKKHKEIYPN